MPFKPTPIASLSFSLSLSPPLPPPPVKAAASNDRTGRFWSEKSMAIKISSLEKKYIDTCKRQGILPNPAILASFFKAQVKKWHPELCSFEVFLDHLKDSDFHSLLEVFKEFDASEIEAVDIFHESSCALSGEYALTLMRAIKQKLRVVDLQDYLFGKEFLRDLARRGLTCQILNLRSSHFRKLNLVGKFMQIRTLNLDFSTSLTSFREDCFTCMPNLMCLSMCETRVTNLWTTTAALLKLPSLVELRFQNCLCCNDTRSCPTSGGNTNGIYHLADLDCGPDVTAPSIFSIGVTNHSLRAEEMLRNRFHRNAVMDLDVQSTAEDSSDDSEVDFSNQRQEYSFRRGLTPDAHLGWNEHIDLQSEVNYFDSLAQNELESLASAFSSRHISAFSDIPFKKYISHHPSPICFENHYREYMITSLPQLKVLDNLPIRNVDREMANAVFAQFFEYLPYRRKHKESVVSILLKREIRATDTHVQTPKLRLSSMSGLSQSSYSRSFCAAKMGCSAWPLLQPLSIFEANSGDETRSFRPRQFEYHPSNSSLMVIGTLDGEVVVINHENGRVVSYIPSLGAMNSVLGLCWLKKHPYKLIAGADNGSLRLYDIQHRQSAVRGVSSASGSVAFDEFDQLTSVHVNSNDELFLASGYSRHVALYDISSGRRLQVFTEMHREHINVVKFANHSPSIFATSSFDHDVKLWDLRQKPTDPCYTSSSSRGNVMVCFSPDDHYLLVSAIDNEVKQLLAVDGRLHLNFEIAPTGSSMNYTRSYYMNGGDYVISGGCDEHVVHICCAQSGRRLRDLSLEGRRSGASMFVQSLRGDPYRDFNMSILATYMHPSSKSEIVKVNFLASSDHAKEKESLRHAAWPSNSMGG